MNDRQELINSLQELLENWTREIGSTSDMESQYYNLLFKYRSNGGPNNIPEPSDKDLENWTNIVSSFTNGDSENAPKIKSIIEKVESNLNVDDFTLLTR